MNQITQRLEDLFAERDERISRYAELWAVHGGGSAAWENTLLEIETHKTKEAIRAKLATRGEVKANALKDALRADPEYQQAVERMKEGRRDWAKVREEWTTLTWRIQLEMAKLRLELGDEARPAALALDTEDHSEPRSSTDDDEG